MQSTRLCFIRHGETDWNVAMRLQGHRDMPLNEVGLQQAAALGRRFAGLSASAVYSSDLQRARQTAEAVAAALGVPVVALDALRERNFGNFEGFTFAEIAAVDAAAYAALAARDPDYAPPGCDETLRSLRARIVGCIERLVAAHPGQSVVVVVHGGVLDIINRHARGLPLEAPRDFEIPNTGLNWISISEGRWTIDCWGEASHLGDAAEPPATVHFP